MAKVLKAVILSDQWVNIGPLPIDATPLLTMPAPDKITPAVTAHADSTSRRMSAGSSDMAGSLDSADMPRNVGADFRSEQLPPATPNPEDTQSAYNKGYQQGFADANDKINEQITTLKSLLNSVPKAVQDNRQQLSAEIADIVLMIAQRFFIHQQHQKGAIANQVNQAIALLNDKQHIDILLHPLDIARLKQSEVTLDIKPSQNARIIASEELQLGGCVIRSEHGVFDASIERQIDNLKRVLLDIKQDTQGTCQT